LSFYLPLLALSKTAFFVDPLAYIDSKGSMLQAIFLSFATLYKITALCTPKTNEMVVKVNETIKNATIKVEK
jgi:hypothetical protein